MMVNKLLGRNVLCMYSFIFSYLYTYSSSTKCTKRNACRDTSNSELYTWKSCGTIPLTSLFKLNIFLLLEWSFSLPNYWRNFPILVAFLPQLATEFSSASVICWIFLTKTKKLGSFRHFKIILNTIFMIILQHILIT